jgi:hypothetical protein
LPPNGIGLVVDGFQERAVEERQRRIHGSFLPVRGVGGASRATGSEVLRLSTALKAP